MEFINRLADEKHATLAGVDALQKALYSPHTRHPSSMSSEGKRGRGRCLPLGRRGRHD